MQSFKKGLSTLLLAAITLDFLISYIWYFQGNYNNLQRECVVLNPAEGCAFH